jgi:HPt (histidine-containing phosphotransfer) domain-containing protein
MLDFQNTPEVGAPALVPEQVVDRSHLGRMTLGDRSLENEVLRLFERQADMLIARMATATPANIKALAHTLDGSARGIGAWRVSQAAKVVESAVAENGDIGTAIAALKSAADEALALIADMLQVH